MAFRSLDPHGHIEINLGWRGAWQKVRLIGGPFDGFKKGPNNYLVAVRAERIKEGDADIHLPIQDFSVPKHRIDVEITVLKAVEAALEGKNVYVGCMGGYGRTGLVLAIVAKVLGVENPVSFVRENYHPNAVETDPQKEYVEAFDVRDMRTPIYFDAWFYRLPKWLRDLLG